MKPIIFAWIDDTAGRQKLLQHLVESGPAGLSVGKPVFVELIKGKKQTALANFLTRKSAPSLVIIDQVLNKCEWELNIPMLGSSLAEIIRQQWPACPIVGITAGKNIAAESRWYDFEKMAEFEDLIEAQHFGQAVEQIYSLASGFDVLKAPKALSIKRIVTLLIPPGGEVERLASALPDEIRKSSNDKSVPRLTALWIRKRLMGRPGFLYDRNWTANLLGLTPKGFSKVEHIFAAAKYSGVFATGSNPRWWGLTLKDILFNTVQNANTNLTWVVGQNLPGLNALDHSKCYVCGKPHPEILGRADTSSDERHPMHINCTTPDLQSQSLLYYDDMRVMKD